MDSIPNIVRERLRAAAPAVNHPDADVLTAFTERSLPEVERAIVVEHLARCTECRDIVAIACPPTDAADTVTFPARTRWLTWPALRWGLAAAGLVVVASVGIVQIQRSSRHETTTVARETSSQNSYVQVPASPPETPAPAAAAPTSEADKTAADADTRFVAPSAGRAAKPEEPKLTDQLSPAPLHRPQTSNAVAGLANFGPKAPTQWQQNGANRAQNVAGGAAAGTQQFSYNLANVPAAPQRLEVTAAAPKAEMSQTEMQASRQVPSASQPSEQFDLAPGPVKAKPAVKEIRGAAFDLAIPRWAISSAGDLERSFDQGNTWQTVDVAASATPRAGETALAVMAKSVPAAPPSRQKDVYNKKTPAAPSPAPVFRAIAATGAEVWVGGSNGALFHSVDAGNHWMQVVPSAAGANLSGDIVRLEFSDAQHGTIITSTAEVWTTGDDGQTWQKR